MPPAFGSGLDLLNFFLYDTPSLPSTQPFKTLSASIEASPKFHPIRKV